MDIKENKNEIIEYIVGEIKGFDRVEKCGLVKEETIRENVNLFLDFLIFPTDFQDVAGLPDRLVPVLETFASGEFSKEYAYSVLGTVNLTEIYARKILYYKNRNRLEWILKERLGYTTVLEGLGIKSNSAEFDRKQMATIRNVEGAHQAQTLSNREMYERIAEFLADYVILTYKCRGVITCAVESEQYSQKIENIRPIMEAYQSKVIEEYEKKGGEKTFTILSLRKYLNNKDLFEDIEDSVIFEDKLYDEIRKESSVVRVVGGAGTGKSRFLEHISYLDAKKNGEFSVVIELGSWRYPQDTVISLLCGKLSCNTVTVKEILDESISIYLDGVNEILYPAKEKKQILNSIEEFHNDYPNVKLIITDRENSALSLFGDMRTYIMQKITYPIACDFVEKNCDNNIAYITSELEHLFNDKNSINTVASPFMLLTMIKLVENGCLTGRISVKDIIPAYVNNKIQREIDEKGDTDAKKIPFLLATLSGTCTPLEEEEHYYRRADVIAAFSECIKKFSFDIDAMNILDDVIVPMELLKKTSENFYYFEHKIYEDYFFSYALEEGIIDLI